MLNEATLGIIIGSLLTLLAIMIIYLIKLPFSKKKHNLSKIREKLIELNKASEIIKSNSDELNQIMIDLENA